MPSDPEIAALQKELYTLKREYLIAVEQLKAVDRLYTILAEKFEVLKDRIKSIDPASGEA